MFNISNLLSGLFCFLIFAFLARSSIISIFSKNYEDRHKDLKDCLNKKHEERRILFIKLNEIKSQIYLLEDRITYEKNRTKEEIKNIILYNKAQQDIKKRKEMLKMYEKYMDGYLHNLDNSIYDNFIEVSKNIDL